MSSFLFVVAVLLGAVAGVFIIAATSSSYRSWRAGGPFGPYSDPRWNRRSLERAPAEARPHLEEAIRLSYGGVACMMGSYLTHSLSLWLR